MVFLSRECAVCLQDIPMVPPQERKKVQIGEETQMETKQDPRYDPQSFPPDEVLQTCSKTHRLDICYSCLNLFISTKLDTCGPAACNAIKCPGLTCHHVYTFDEIKNITTTATFSRYDELLTRKVLGDDPNFRWCLNPRCGSGASYYTADVWEEMSCLGMVFEVDSRLTEPGRWIKCQECGFEMCFEHQLPCPARPRSRLEQQKNPISTFSAEGCALCRHDLLNHGSEESTEKWIAKNTKRCPRDGCRVPIEKKSGCAHMTCANCQFDFCWDCMDAYDPDRDRCSCMKRSPVNDTNIQSRAAELLASDDLYSRAIRSYDFGYDSAMERLRNLDRLGVVAESRPTGFWDPLPDLPHPQANVRGESLQQRQNRGGFTPDQNDFRNAQYRDHLRQIELDVMACGEMYMRGPPMSRPRPPGISFGYEPSGRQRPPPPIPMEPTPIPHLPPVPYGVPQSSDPQREEHQGKNNGGRVREIARDVGLTPLVIPDLAEQSSPGGERQQKNDPSHGTP